MLDRYADCEVVALDALTYAGDLETLLPLMDNDRFLFVRGDICDRDTVFGLIAEEQPDAIVNFAAESHVDRSIEDPGIFVATNVLGTQVLLDAAVDMAVPRFHQVSTDEVYGDLPLNRPDLFFHEDTPLSPSSPYSASKASADLLTLAYYRTFDLPVTISRCSNNYGPYQYPEKLIPLTIANAAAYRPVPVYGEGLNVRDWLYVKDHCTAIERILEDGRSGEVYNVGGHNEMRNIDIVRIILEQMGRDDDLIQFVEDRPGHDQRYAIAPDKMRDELRWEPDTRFEDGIRSTIDWYLANEAWWKNILSGEYLEFENEYFEVHR